MSQLEHWEANSIGLPNLPNGQHKIHRSRPISFAVEGYVLESEWLKNGHETCRHPECHCAAKVVRCDLNANDFPMMAHTSFIEAKLSERILAGFNGASASLVTKIFMFASGCAERMRRNRIGAMIFEGTGRV